MRILTCFAALALAAPAAAQPGATATETVRCAIDYAPERACRMTDTAAAGGLHRMVFRAGGRTLTFVGREQTGWWSGKLDGRPAMAYERDRGHVVLSTYDLRTTFSWSYGR